jgi:hypothetical protein
MEKMEPQSSRTEAKRLNPALFLVRKSVRSGTALVKRTFNPLFGSVATNSRS